MVKQEIASALQVAQKEKNRVAVSALRLALAAIHDLEISARAEGRSVRPDEVHTILRRMVRQREESATAFRAGKREELARQEENEIAVLRDFLPQELNETELGKVLDELIRETGATSLRDLGSVMAGLKEQYAGRVDMRRAAELLRPRLEKSS